MALHATAKADVADDRVKAAVAEKVADHQVVEKAVVPVMSTSFSIGS